MFKESKAVKCNDQVEYFDNQKRSLTLTYPIMKISTKKIHLKFSINSVLSNYSTPWQDYF